MSELNLEDTHRETIRSSIRDGESIERSYREIGVSHNLDHLLRELHDRVLRTVRTIWRPDAPGVLRALHGLDLNLSNRGEQNLPNIREIANIAYEKAEDDIIDGRNRRDRIESNTDEATRRIFNNRRSQSNFTEREAQGLFNPQEEPVDVPQFARTRYIYEKQIAEKRRDDWARFNLNLSGFKRLVFSEKMKQIQFAQIQYLMDAGYYYARWTLSPTHPRGDICDLCAKSVWLDERDQDDYFNITHNRNLGGVILLAHENFGEVIPQLNSWSDNKIANGILQHSTIDHPKPDLRRKRSGFFPPHPICKCFLSPILESRV